MASPCSTVILAFLLVAFVALTLGKPQYDMDLEYDEWGVVHPQYPRRANQPDRRKWHAHFSSSSSSSESQSHERMRDAHPESQSSESDSKEHHPSPDNGIRNTPKGKPGPAVAAQRSKPQQQGRTVERAYERPRQRGKSRYDLYGQRRYESLPTWLSQGHPPPQHDTIVSDEDPRIVPETQAGRRAGGRAKKVPAGKAKKNQKRPSVPKMEQDIPMYAEKREIFPAGINDAFVYFDVDNSPAETINGVAARSSELSPEEKMQVAPPNSQNKRGSLTDQNSGVAQEKRQLFPEEQLQDFEEHVAAERHSPITKRENTPEEINISKRDNLHPAPDSVPLREED